VRDFLLILEGARYARAGAAFGCASACKQAPRASARSERARRKTVSPGGSQHCPTRRHLNGGHTPGVQHYEPVAMLGAKHARIMTER
jgi:hypothetical protein